VKDGHASVRRVGVLIVVAAVAAVGGAAIEHAVSVRHSSSARHVGMSYPAEVSALGIDPQVADGALVTFGNEECQAARRAHSDRGSALLKFKAAHVANAYRAHDQAAIEAFRTLFIATGHLLCPDVEPVILASSRPLL
jgi:hypothetical protein